MCLNWKVKVVYEDKNIIWNIKTEYINLCQFTYYIFLSHLTALVIQVAIGTQGFKACSFTFNSSSVVKVGSK